MSEPIPYNLITGFLGAGKTTTLEQLLRQKPTDERWAVLINEFGRAGVDGALVQPSQGVFLETVAGGCLCCDAELMFRVALHRLLKKARPHRLLIEPTGLGHAWRIAQVMSEPQHRALLTAHATLCVVSAEAPSQAHASSHPAFHEQLWLADRVLLNKCDAVDPTALAHAMDWLEQRGVARDTILQTRFGQVEATLLDLPAGERPPRFFPANPTREDLWQSLPTGRTGVQLWQGESQGWQVLSLLGSDDWALAPGALEWLKTLPTPLRCKGILQGEGGWQALNASGQQWSLTPLQGGERLSLELMWPTSTGANSTSIADQLLGRLVGARV